MNHQPNPEFDAIAIGLQHELRDPTVVDMLGAVLEAEVALNRGDGDLEFWKKAEVLSLLNNDLRSRGLWHAPAVISGKVRIMGGGEDDFDDVTLLPEIRALGEQLFDENGPYYQVSRYPVFIGEFDTEDTTETLADGSTRTTYQVYQQFNTHPDADPSEGSLFFYPRELDVYEPVEPSFEKMKRDIFENYPEIADQIKGLPEDSSDDAEIFEALKNFRLTIDWSKHPTLDEEDRSELIESIVHVVTERLGLDDDLYELSVQGTVYTMTASEHLTSRDVKEPTDLRGMIGNIRIVGNTQDGSSITYAPDIEFALSTGERRGGRHLVYIPIGTVKTVRNLRNVPLFGMDAYELNGGVEVEIERVKTEEPKEPAVETTERYSSREEELIDYEKSLQDMLSYCTEVSAQTFDSEEEVKEAQQELVNYLNVFSALSPNPKPVLEMYEPGVIAAHIERSVESASDDEVVVRFSNMHLEEVGLFAKKGILFNYAIESGEKSTKENDESKGYKIEAQMIIQDIEPDSPMGISRDEETDLDYYVLHNQRFFYAYVDSGNTTVSIPELERLKEISQLIEKIKTELPDLKSLPGKLRTLQKLISETHPVKFTFLPDIELVNSIGNDVGGDETATKRVVDVLAEIMNEKEVVIAGDMYTEAGELVQQEMSGVVSDVVGDVDVVPVGEPMLKIIDADKNVYFVPLSTIESMRI